MLELRINCDYSEEKIAQLVKGIVETSVLWEKTKVSMIPPGLV